MRDESHYLDLFADTDTVGRQLLAQAICSVTGDDVRDVTRGLPETSPSADASRKIIDAVLDSDPIPASGLRAVLDHLVESGAIATSSRNRGISWLADQVDCSRSAVTKWVGGDRELRGPSAVAVRAVIREAL